jgi:hypothetical protein
LTGREITTKPHGTAGSLLVVLTSLAVLSGCGGPQTGPTAIPAAATGSQAGTQKMPGSSGDLLYVSDGKKNIRVFTFPQGDLVQTLTDVNQPRAQCSDRKGNVFISAWGQPGSLVKYAHGGSAIVGVLHFNNFDNAVACSVDSMTGNVAAVTEGNGQGNVYVFAGGQGSSTEYQDSLIEEYSSCAYDRHGNLYIDGKDPFADFALAVMPKGSDQFTNVSVNATIENDAYLQWDKRYLLISAGSKAGAVVYQVRVNGSTGTVVRATSLLQSAGAYTWVRGNTGIAVYAKKRWQRKFQAIGLWAYPAGGKPAQIISSSHFSTKSNITGFTISAAPSGN